MMLQLFGKTKTWKAEYDDTLYKIYDWDGHLAGYLFPHYGDNIDTEGENDEVIEEMNKVHTEVPEATLLLPMVKLGLLDNYQGIDIDYVISSLEANAERSRAWKKWLQGNAKTFSIFAAEVHTAREDRNMLSIALGIVAKFRLGEKEVRDVLAPLLDRLHQDGLL